MRYYLNLHPITSEPETLLRVEHPSKVDVWFGGEWKPTALVQAQLDGLGGDANFRTIPRGDVAAWKERLAG